MKNIDTKIKAILQYEEEVKTARDFYIDDKNKKDNLKTVDDLNIELKAIKEIKKILQI